MSSVEKIMSSEQLAELGIDAQEFECQIQAMCDLGNTMLSEEEQRLSDAAGIQEAQEMQRMYNRAKLTETNEVADTVNLSVAEIKTSWRTQIKAANPTATVQEIENIVAGLDLQYGEMAYDVAIAQSLDSEA